MRKIILSLATSVDGYIARHDGSIDWLPESLLDEESFRADVLARADTVVMGRKTWDLWREREGPKPFPGKKCIVFSRRRAGLTQGRVQFTDEDPETVVRRVREATPTRSTAGGLWIAGGGEIARLCLEAGIVNEIVLNIVPVLLGDGVRLFPPRAGTTWLSLVQSTPLASGMLQLRYVPVRAPRRREIFEPSETPAELVAV
jgi:dihydrofolate reductase